MQFAVGGGVGWRGESQGVTETGAYYRRASRYVTYGATCAINSDVVVVRGRGRETRRTAARAQPSHDLLTITFHVPST